jgi:DNA-binding transcriptional LysR family regulator
MIESYLTSNGVVVRKFAEFDSMLGCLDLISKGEWSAFLPLMMFKSSDFEDSVYTINLIDEPQLNLEMYLVQPARKILDEAATAFIRCLKEEFDRSEKLIRFINPISRKKIKI